MKNRITSVLICGLASLLMIAHSIIPHHHGMEHSKVTHTHCSAYQMPTDCDHVGISHLHEGSDENTLDLCLLVNVISVSNAPSTPDAKKSSLRPGYDSQYLNSLLSTGIVKAQPLDKPSDFPDQLVASLQERQHHSSSGFRAPPRA